LAPPLVSEVKRLLVAHLHDHYRLYDEFIGVRSARKHIGWYVRTLPGGEDFRAQMNLLEDSVAQVAAVEQFFDGLNETMDRIPAPTVQAESTAEEQDMNTHMHRTMEWAA
jgi:tRNA-dihydrouridine synthase B